MYIYILKRLGLIPPTLLGIFLINFLVIQIAPGGPVSQYLHQIRSSQQESLEQKLSPESQNQLEQEIQDRLNSYYRFDLSPSEQFVDLLWKYLRFDFGTSLFRDIAVIDLLIEKLPVSLTLGLWTSLLAYGISIPLGIRKARRNNSSFDASSNFLIIVFYAIPAFIIALLLIIIFAGSSYWQIFPLRGLVSENFDKLSFGEQILDYLWHITLPVVSSVLGSFAVLTFMTKNSFLEEMVKPYVVFAKSLGYDRSQILYKHIFRNGMLIIISTIPNALVGVFFTGSLLIETIFSLDGLGLLAYESILTRDYNVIFSTLYLFSLLGLLTRIVTDVSLMFVDKRIKLS